MCSHSLGILAVEVLTSELACVERVYMLVFHEMASAAQSLPALFDLLPFQTIARLYFLSRRVLPPRRRLERISESAQAFAIAGPWSE